MYARRLKAACRSGFTPSQFVRACAFLRQQIQRSKSDLRADGPERNLRLQALLTEIEAAPLQAEAQTPSQAFTEATRGNNIVRVAFLGGDELMIPLTPGMLIADVKAKVACQRPVPPHHALSFVYQGRLMKNSDESPALGAQLFAIFAKWSLSSTAKARLRESTELDPEENKIGLFEVRDELKLTDMCTLAEILQSVQPERLIFWKRLADGCLQALADYISIDLFQLKSIEIPAPLPKSLPHVARLLRHCPVLDQCRLRPGNPYELAAADVQELRGEFCAKIFI